MYGDWLKKGIVGMALLGAGWAWGSAQDVWEYDAAGRLSRVVFEDGTTVEYVHDLGGNLVSRRVTVPDDASLQTDDGAMDQRETEESTVEATRSAPEEGSNEAAEGE